MAGKKRKKIDSGCPLDLTPMIDVVFQLIIFFIVTMNMDKEKNKDIILEPARNGPVLKEQDPRTMVIEINSLGWISMHGAQLTKEKLRDLLNRRYRKYKDFPVMIYGDARTKHSDIKAVMDICTECNIWSLDFMAISKYSNEK